jgi:hypothetical protein
MSTVTLTAYKPGRNFIRLGDSVRCFLLHGRPFTGTIPAIGADGSNGAVVEVDVIGGPKGRPRSLRTLRPEGIARVAKTRHEAPPGRRP